MADTRTSSPALPRWVRIALGLACIPMGLWASWITLQYFEHGAAALEADPALRSLALSAAMMFVASEMAAFGLAALLTEQQLLARRWLLTGFAAAVLILEICTIIAVQLALTVGGEMSQGTLQDQEKDLRTRITAIESGADARRADAALQRAAGQLTKAAASGDGAAAAQAKTAPLYAALAKVQALKRPTLVGLLGRDYALAYAVARGILVSLGGLVFFGTAGALLRSARGVTPGVTDHADAPAAAAGPSFKQSGATQRYSKGAMLAAGVPLAAMGAMGASPAHAAPVARVTGVAATGVLAQAHQNPTGVLKQAQPDTESVTPAPPAATARKRARTVTAVADGSKLDAGTTGNAAARYNRVKSAVASGTLRPSVRAIQAEEGGGTLVVRRYLQKLAQEGAIVQKGRGWVRA